MTTLTHKEIANFIAEAQAAGACTDQMTPIAAAFAAGDLETVLAGARGSRRWLMNKGLYHPILDNGPAINWHPNGQPYIETTYVNGERHGLYKSWYMNKQLAEETTYEHGKLHGLYKSWCASGQPATEGIYEHGRRVV